MGRIIRLHGDEHGEILTLLPWYVTGQLDGPEHAQVEAHLSGCAECQAEVRFQRRLEAELPALAAPSMDIDQGWQRMRRQLEKDQPPSAQNGAGAWLAATKSGFNRGWRAGGPWLGWAVAASLVLVAGASPQLSSGLARYHALGAPPAPGPGNVVVIFRPDTSERDLRQTLVANHARLVDGPTAADAYVLHVPQAERAGALTRLRGQADIVLAEPIDSGAAP
jgi:anti-sigma factor RsiW